MGLLLVAAHIVAAWLAAQDVAYMPILALIVVDIAVAMEIVDDRRHD